MSNLEKGLTKQGQTTRTHDKRGLRMWVANAIDVARSKDPLSRVKRMMGSKGVSSPKAADGATKRTRTA